jgi:hypothetical protein
MASERSGTLKSVTECAGAFWSSEGKVKDDQIARFGLLDPYRLASSFSQPCSHKIKEIGNRAFVTDNSTTWLLILRGLTAIYKSSKVESKRGMPVCQPEVLCSVRRYSFKMRLALPITHLVGALY